jgi:hypothetical protein
MKVAHCVVKAEYSNKDLDFLVKKGPILSKLKDYQKAIDLIASTYDVPEPLAILGAFKSLNDYYLILQQEQSKNSKLLTQADKLRISEIKMPVQ